MTRRVYLCGPIANTTYDECAMGWRKYVHDRLAYLNFDKTRAAIGLPLSGIEVFSPMRGKAFLKDKGRLGQMAYSDNPVSTIAGIVGRDSFDVKRCDVMFANFLDAEKASIGSACEFGMAHILDKPIVTVLEAGSAHDHIFIRGMSTYITADLDEAIHLTRTLLTHGI